MKVLLITALVLGVAFAAPNKQEIKFRNLYKPAVGAPTSHKPSGRIINGQVAKPHSIPYQAFLQVSGSKGGWYCGGSLISKNVILTAGHCGYEGTVAIVTLGAQSPMKNEATQVTIQSRDIVVHEEFDMDNILNDIALIRLPNSVSLTDAIQIVSLPSDASKTYAGEIGRVSGWGLTDGHGSSLSDELRYTENEILTNAQCEQVFGSIPNYQVCMSGKDGHSGCNGDSGGPFTVNNVQIGIVSYGVDYCPSGYPSVFTRTTSFLNWIEKNSSV